MKRFLVAVLFSLLLHPLACQDYGEEIKPKDSEESEEQAKERGAKPDEQERLPVVADKWAVDYGEEIKPKDSEESEEQAADYGGEIKPEKPEESEKRAKERGAESYEPGYQPHADVDLWKVETKADYGGEIKPEKSEESEERAKERSAESKP